MTEALTAKDWRAIEQRIDVLTTKVAEHSSNARAQMSTTLGDLCEKRHTELSHVLRGNGRPGITDVLTKQGAHIEALQNDMSQVRELQDIITSLRLEWQEGKAAVVDLTRRMAESSETSDRLAREVRLNTQSTPPRRATVTEDLDFWKTPSGKNLVTSVIGLLGLLTGYLSSLF